jgi:O-antigen/teichoic acid export membrane protein
LSFIKELKLLAKNSISLMSAYIIGIAITLVTYGYISRLLGATGFGYYTFIFAYVAIFLGLSNLGVNSISIREISRKPKLISHYLSDAIVLKLFLTFFSITILNLIAYFLNQPTFVRLAIFVASFAFLFDNLSSTFNIIFYSSKKMEYKGGIDVFEKLLRLFLIYIFTHLEKSLEMIVLAVVISSAGSLIFRMFFSSLKTYPIKFLPNMKRIKSLLRLSFPLGISGLIYTFYLKIGIISLSFLKGPTQVGIYSAGFNLIVALLFLPGCLGEAVFPPLSNYYHNSIQEFKKTFFLLTKYLFVFSLPLIIFIFAFSDKIINTIYTREFSKAIVILEVLSIALFFNIFNIFNNYVLIASNNIKKLLKYNFISLIIYLIGIFSLVRIFGALGLAFCYLFSEFILFCLIYSKLYPYLKPNFYFKQLLLPILASLMMLFLVFYFRQISLKFVIPFGIYLLLLYLNKWFWKSDFLLINGKLTYG